MINLYIWIIMNSNSITLCTYFKQETLQIRSQKFGGVWYCCCGMHTSCCCSHKHNRPMLKIDKPTSSNPIQLRVSTKIAKAQIKIEGIPNCSWCHLQLFPEYQPQSCEVRWVSTINYPKLLQFIFSHDVCLLPVSRIKEKSKYWIMGSELR